jgi:hypothetical protein
VSACPCLDYDATVDVCSAYHTFDDGWTTVPFKNKKERDPVHKGLSQIKSHMMTAMSSDNDSVIVKFRGDLNKTPPVNLRKEVVLQYKTLV